MRLYGTLSPVQTVKGIIKPAFRVYGKLNAIPGKIGEETVSELVPVSASMVTHSPIIQAIIGSAELLPYENWHYWQETDDNAKTTATITATPTAKCLLVVAVMHRDTVSIVGDDWNEVAVSLAGTSDSVNQYITVWSKTVEAGTYEITVNQNSSVRMSLKAIALYNAVSVSVVDNVIWEATPFSPTPTTGSRRLYLLSSVWADTTNAITAIDTGELDLLTAEETRFSAFYDYQPELSITPNFESTKTVTGINAITLDVDEDYTFLIDSDGYMLIDSEGYILTV